MICWVGDCSPPAFVLRELELHESKRGIEPKLDQGEVPSERLESFHRKYQFLRKCHMHTSVVNFAKQASEYMNISLSIERCSMSSSVHLQVSVDEVKDEDSGHADAELHGGAEAAQVDPQDLQLLHGLDVRRHDLGRGRDGDGDVLP